MPEPPPSGWSWLRRHVPPLAHVLPVHPPRLPRLSLFWRTFSWLALLLALTSAAWQFAFRTLEAEPRALEVAEQLAELVQLSRTTLEDMDPIQRLVLIKSLEHKVRLKLQLAESKDRWAPYDDDAFARSVASALSARLGPGTVVARQLQGQDGLWVRFQTGSDAYWLRARTEPSSTLPVPSAWWLLLLLAATLLGSAVIAAFINRPLRELSIAAENIRDGDYDSQLDEHALTSEIREVNRGFNRMARVLAKLEQERSVMMAGISHDLRTPLARLRLEIEMSVHDDAAREAMAEDINQVDAIISKFMDYARPGEVHLQEIDLSELLRREAQRLRNPAQIRVELTLAPGVKVLGDPTELQRVLLNLFENARRYGHAAGEPARVVVEAEEFIDEVVLTVRDHGPGVPKETLARLVQPFYRGDAARTSATGSGLGLAIVDKAVQRMGGQLEIDNAPQGGLRTRLRLPRP